MQLLNQFFRKNDKTNLSSAESKQSTDFTKTFFTSLTPTPSVGGFGAIFFFSFTSKILDRPV